MLRTFNSNNYFHNTYGYVYDNLRTNVEGSTSLKLEPFMDVNDDETFSRGQFEIEAHHINFVDWVCLRTAMDRAEFEDCEIGSFDFSEYRTIEELNEIYIPTSYAGEYISSSETINGNHYNSNCDTYASMMGNPAYNLFFLYVVDLEKYVVVTQRYLEL